jgi:hypothetical protein
VLGKGMAGQRNASLCNGFAQYGRTQRSCGMTMAYNAKKAKAKHSFHAAMAMKSDAEAKQSRALFRCGIAPTRYALIR